ncbi:hypothetical protein ACJRO7_020548 [Eucalyptus globulus]|uniref:NB-ARC domain-containing protein n=1 Tax=Eucalyptus globulus TaxID=34317 RepID=A0ABD3KPU2_EUCGL
MEGKREIKERLCSKKVLLLLDDADDASQLDALVQKHEWFGKGSKIIISTRDRGILNVDETYELTGMNFDHSLKLFSRHAFRRDYPLDQYISHSERAVNMCNGLPLALEVIGSLLSGKSEEEWDATLKELEESPQENVRKKLMISIEALNENQRKIFLDVACFFIGYDKRIVIHLWESCKLLPHQSLGILQQRSLIKIRDDNQLWMHDWLRDIGRTFIEEGSGMKPENQQWVWTHEQALDVLEKMQSGGGFHGIGSIEALCLELPELSRYSLMKEFLGSLLNLRFLRMDVKFINGCKLCETIDSMKNIWRSNFLGNGEFFLNLLGPLVLPKSRLILPELRWLSWNNMPSHFELSHISMRKLVILDISRSKLEETWHGWSHIKLAENLKVLNLSRCKLNKTLDLPSHKKLEQLILEGCESLVEIDSSIGHLKNLVFLNLKDCKRLQKLPDEMGALESLMELLLDSTAIKEIHECGRMKNLKILSLVKCKSLNIFSFIGCPTSVAKLSLVNNHFNSLIELDLSRTKIRVLPYSIPYMKKLKVLKLCNCPLIQLPCAIGINIGKLPILRKLVLEGSEIPAMPQLPESLITLTIDTSSIRGMPDLSNLLNLRNLKLHVSFEHPSKLEEDPSSWGIGRLRMLEVLDLICPDIGTLSFDLVLLSELKELHIQCRNLQCLPMLPTNLSYLCIWFCNRIKATSDISNLKALSSLKICFCKELAEIEGLEGLENLRTLFLDSLPLAKLSDLTSLKKLKEISLMSCTELVEIPECPELLEILEIVYCVKLQKWPDPSSFKNLKFSRF